jgi:hypothetical protein
VAYRATVIGALLVSPLLVMVLVIQALAFQILALPCSSTAWHTLHVFPFCATFATNIE